jgi:PAS domain S-box-containing protein
MVWHTVRQWAGFRYLVAIFVVLAAAFVRIKFFPLLGSHAPYITFYPSVIVAALVGGLPAGLTATALSAVLASLLVIESDSLLSIDSPPALLGMGIFVVSCVMISGIAEALHRSRARAITANTELRLAVEQEEAASKLRESQGLLNSLVEGISDAIYVKDRQGRYLLFNSAAERITGKSVAETIGKDDTFLFPPAEAQILMERDRSVMVGRKEITYEEVLTDAKGGVRTFLATKGPLFDAQGNVTGLFGIARDITERKASEQTLAERESALRESEELLRLFIEHAPVSLAMFDREMQYLYASRRWLSDYKLGERDIRGISHYEVFPEITEEWREIHRRCLAGEVMRTEADRFERADGSVQWVRWEIRPWHDPSGEVGGIVMFTEDITERKQADEALRRAKDEWERTFNSVPDLIAIIDSRYRILRVNSAMARRLGKTPDECVGQSCYSSVHGADHPPEFCPHALTLANSGEHMIEVQDDHLGGYFQIRATPFLDEQGQMTGTVHIVHDITEQKRAEERVSKLNAELEQRVRERTAQLAASNRELESFSYSVSHDLQAPLRHMAGYSRFLLEDYGDKLDHQGATYLRRIMGACDKMGRLIDSLLELSRISRAELKIQTIDLSRLASEVINELRQRNPDRIVQVAITEELTTEGDPVLLRAVLENLLGNAWKYTRHAVPATIELGAERTGGKTVFFVRDNGVGFDMTYSDKLFGAFQRLHTEAEFEGTGIGLATVQRIIHRHGGDVWVHAQEGKGATFYFTLG